MMSGQEPMPLYDLYLTMTERLLDNLEEQMLERIGRQYGKLWYQQYLAKQLAEYRDRKEWLNTLARKWALVRNPDTLDDAEQAKQEDYTARLLGLRFYTTIPQKGWCEDPRHVDDDKKSEGCFYMMRGSTPDEDMTLFLCREHRP